MRDFLENKDKEERKLDPSKSLKILIASISDFYQIAKDYSIPKIGSSIDVKIFNMNLVLSIPEREHLDYAEDCMCLAEIITEISFIDLMFLYFSLLKEKSIIFVSESRRKISLAIKSLFSLIKPLNFIFPVIYSIPEYYLSVLEAVVPIVGGKNQTYNFRNFN